MHRSRKLVIADRKKEKIEHCNSNHVTQLTKIKHSREKWKYTIQEHVLWFDSNQQLNPTQLLDHSPPMGSGRELEG